MEHTWRTRASENTGSNEGGRIKESQQKFRPPPEQRLCLQKKKRFSPPRRKKKREACQVRGIPKLAVCKEKRKKRGMGKALRGALDLFFSLCRYVVSWQPVPSICITPFLTLAFTRHVLLLHLANPRETCPSAPLCLFFCFVCEEVFIHLLFCNRTNRHRLPTFFVASIDAAGEMPPTWPWGCCSRASCAAAAPTGP